MKKSQKSNIQRFTPPTILLFINLFVIIFLLIGNSNKLFSQNQQDYYVSIKPEFALGTIQKTINPDQTLTFSMNNTDFATFLNAKPVYYFEKAFPTAVLEKNKRVYKVTLDNDTHLSDFMGRSEVQYAELIKEQEIELYIPNDYDYIDRNGPNTALEIIKAPLAWNITTGNTNMLAGVYDRHFNIQHEDTENKIVQIYPGAVLNSDIYNNYHGTMVSTTLAGETDNNKGVASIGYSTSLIITSYGTANKILQLSQQPGVRVINISQQWGCDYIQATEDILEEVWNGNELYPPVVIFAAAGNGNAAQAANPNVERGYCLDQNGEGNGYLYPAAYNHVIAVSALGHLVPRGSNDIFYNYGVSWEDVARLDINNPNSTTTHNDKVDLSAPGRHVLTANRGVNSYSRHSGTSLASPIVTGAAALMLDVNPNLTSNQVRGILKNTTDEIYHIFENIEYTDLYGTGRLNAYRAVLTAKCMADPGFAPNLDLMIRNSLVDYGDEPDTNTEYTFWNSQDIWVRNQQDGKAIRIHQNPEYNPGNPNYVYVRVTNRSCITSTGEEELKLYWAKASTNLDWENSWNGTYTVGDNIPLGGPVGTLNIPSLEPGQEAILEFEWAVPNPNDYLIHNIHPQHFCLVARIDTPADPMTFPEGNDIVLNVKNNNNIAMKNLTVVMTTTPGIAIKPGGSVQIGNLTGNTPQNYFFELSTPEINSPVFDEAEVLITLNETAFERWLNGGSMAENIEVFNEEKRELLITGNDAKLLNMEYDAGEWDILFLSFNFLTEEVTGKSTFEFHLIQKNPEGEAVGGEVYQIVRDPERSHFEADGDSYENTDDETILLASDIGEPAIYNWYTPEGKLLHSGKEFVFVPDMPGDYLLEVIAEADGHKDYFKLTLSVSAAQDQIVSLSPNPATNTVTVEYQINNSASSASLKIASFFGSIMNNYPIDLTNINLNVNLEGYPPGHYAVILTVDGQTVHAKQLIIN